MTPELIFRASRMLTTEGVIAGSVVVAGGKIVEVAVGDLSAGDSPIVELAEDEVLLPGLVDTHVHVNEPGRTDWEGFASATRAAAAGGVTTLLDMPLNSIPPTTSPEALAVSEPLPEASARSMWGSGAARYPKTWDSYAHCMRPASSASS